MHNGDLVVSGGVRSLMFAADLRARLELRDDAINDTLYAAHEDPSDLHIVFSEM